jgi:acyl-CoA thioester hydrolase
MGHMNTQFYASLYDGATLHFLALLCSSAELKAAGHGWADVRQLIEYKREVVLGNLLVVRSTLKRLGDKSIGYRHDLVNTETHEVHATSEQVTVLFDLAQRKAVPLSDTIRKHTAALQLGTCRIDAARSGAPKTLR